MQRLKELLVRQAETQQLNTQLTLVKTKSTQVQTPPEVEQESGAADCRVQGSREAAMVQ